MTSNLEHSRIKNILDETLSLFPEIRMRYKHISIRDRNSLSSFNLKLIKEKGYDKNFSYFIYHDEDGQGNRISILTFDQSQQSDDEIRKVLAHEYAETLFKRDREIAEKIRNFPLLSRIPYSILRLRIDIKADKEAEKRLGRRETKPTAYDYFSDRRRIVRQPIKSLKYFMQIMKFYEQTREKTYVT